MKIFIGTNENCGILHGISEGFKELGHEVVSFVKQRDSFFADCKYDYDVSGYAPRVKFFKAVPILRGIEFRWRNWQTSSKIRRIFNKNLLDFDLYVFTWGSVLPDLEDLYILKKLKKKIDFVFIGSEARFFLSFKQQFHDINIPWPDAFLQDNLNKKLFFIRRVELLADSIHALPDLSGLFVRPYYPTYIPYIIKNYPDRDNYNDIPIIVHAPSNRDLKGTRLILSCIDRLKKEGVEFTFKLLEGLPNSNVLEELRNADIAIDQIYLHYPGIFSTEAMAMGCAVATRTFEGDENTFFHPPVCNVNESNIYNKLKHLIGDKKYRLLLAKAGKEYVRSTNAPRAVAQKILDGLDPRNKPVYYPEFFYKYFVKRDDMEISTKVKQLTREVLEKFLEKDTAALYLHQLEKRGLA